MPGYPQTPTFPIDLRGGAGIKVRRTGPTANTIVLDAILGNDALAPMAAGTLKANLLGSASIPQDVTLAALGAALGLKALAYKDAAAISDVTGLQAALNAKQAALGFTPENVATKGQANGYAPLGTDGKVPAANLPPGNGGVTSVDSLTDASGSGKAVLKGSPAQGRTALELGNGATRDVGTTAGTLVDGADPRLQASANAIVKGNNTAPAPNWATYNTPKQAVHISVAPLPVECIAGGGQYGTVDTILGTVDIPYANGQVQAIHSTGISGIARTADRQQGAVGVFGAAMPAQTGPAGDTLQVFGANFVVTNKNNLVPSVPNQGRSNCEIYGIEIDVACEKLPNGSSPTNTHIRGTWTTGNCEVQPDGALIGHYVGYAGAFTAVPWKQAFRCMDGAAQTSLMAGFQPGNGAVGSAPVIMRSRDGNGTTREGQISTDAGGNIVLAPGGGAAVALAPGGIASAFVLNINTLNVSSSANIAGNLVVNGVTTTSALNAGTINGTGSISSPGVTCTNLVVATNINYMGQNVGLCAAGPIPAGFKGLIIPA